MYFGTNFFMKDIILLKVSLVFVILIACKQETLKPYSNNTISAAHPLASLAGKSMFEQGGNAFDAAVAAAFTLAVVEPSMSGIGGRLQAIYQNHLGDVGGVDAATQVPESYITDDKKNAYGYKTIGIPGVVAGLLKLHSENGKLGLIKVMQPAIKFATEGFKLLPGEAIRQKLAREITVKFEGTKIHFLKKDGTSFSAGDIIIQKELANTLNQIALKGKAGFYEGEIAQKMVEDIQSNGGILTLDDLKNYNARDAEILTGLFQGNKIHSLYLPSFGAITIQILQILDNLSKPTSEEEWALDFGEATKIAYTNRKHQEDRDSLSEIISYENAKSIAISIEKGTQKKIAKISNHPPESWTVAMGHTSHLTTADAEGNVVSLTQTIGPNMGSKVATEGLGFLYAVTLGGYLGEFKPGDRSNSHISPTLFTKNNKVILALGAAGGSRIITAVTQVAHRYFSKKQKLYKSIMLPRVYPFEDSLWIENHEGLKSLNAELDPLIFPIKMINEKARFGRVHAVALDTIKNAWIGAADPDWEGTTEYFESP